VALDDPAKVKGKRVLVIEDGPTITHGGMRFGAGFVAAQAADASEIIDPRTVATRTRRGNLSPNIRTLPMLSRPWAIRRRNWPIFGRRSTRQMSMPSLRGRRATSGG
jgi:hypothetical protein